MSKRTDFEAYWIFQVVMVRTRWGFLFLIQCTYCFSTSTWKMYHYWKLCTSLPSSVCPIEISLDVELYLAAKSCKKSVMALYSQLIFWLGKVVSVRGIRWPQICKVISRATQCSSIVLTETANGGTPSLIFLGAKWPHWRQWLQVAH